MNYKITKTLCIISCGHKKIWNNYPNFGPAKAEEAYTGNYFKCCKRYYGS